jgi:hypothetical protein
MRMPPGETVMKKFNWPIWAGFLLTVFAFLSYPFLFVNWPLTRDFPWANLLLFALAAVLLFLGLRRAFSPGRRWPSKVAGGILTALSVLVIAGFVFAVFIGARQLPASQGAPQVGQKAPEFTLVDINNKPVSFSELRTAPINGRSPKGALLIFYRGYW